MRKKIRTGPGDQMTHECQVCGDVAAGYHFGAFTCEGCKSFFGRTCKPLKKQRPGIGGRMRCGTPEPPEPKTRLSECKIGGRCIVQGRNRTGCKRCRWEKCLQANMSRGNSRYGRRSNYFKVTCMIEQKQRMNAEARAVASIPESAVREQQNSPISDHVTGSLKSSKKTNELVDDRQTTLQTTLVPICKPVATLPMFCPPPWPALGLLGSKASPTPPFVGGLWPLFDQLCWSFSPQLQVAKEPDDQTEPLDLSTKRPSFRSMIDLSKRDIPLKIEYDFLRRTTFPLTSADVFFRGN